MIRDMREWLTIERTRKNEKIPDGQKPLGHIPRCVAEKKLERFLGGAFYLSPEEVERLRSDPEWRTQGMTWVSPLGFWYVNTEI